MIAEINQDRPELSVLLFSSEVMLDLNLLLETVQKAARHLIGEDKLRS